MIKVRGSKSKEIKYQIIFSLLRNLFITYVSFLGDGYGILVPNIILFIIALFFTILNLAISRPELKMILFRRLSIRVRFCYVAMLTDELLNSRSREFNIFYPSKLIFSFIIKRKIGALIILINPPNGLNTMIRLYIISIGLVVSVLFELLNLGLILYILIYTHRWAYLASSIRLYELSNDSWDIEARFGNAVI